MPETTTPQLTERQLVEITRDLAQTSPLMGGLVGLFRQHSVDLLQDLRALRAERDSWRRVAEKLEGEKVSLREQLARTMTECDSLRLRLNAAMQLPLVISNARKEQTDD